MATRWIPESAREKNERRKKEREAREKFLRDKGLLPEEEQNQEIYKLDPNEYPTEWAVFSYIDADGSNTITAEELYSGLDDLGFGSCAAFILKALDDDGSNNVNFEEFVDGFATLWSTNAGKALATAVLDAALKEETSMLSKPAGAAAAASEKTGGGTQRTKTMPSLGTVDRKEQVAWEEAKEVAKEDPRRKDPKVKINIDVADLIPRHLTMPQDQITVNDIRGWLSKRGDDTVSRVYEGDLKLSAKQDDAVFRFFLSSTFSDTGAERNYLMQWAYPELRAYCRARGLDFEPVELRWGIREEATDDQQTVNICLNELTRCQENTVGPNFIYIGTDKYGWRPPPERLEATVFEKLHGLCSIEDKRVLDVWYLRNGNLEPPMYMLQKISAILPDFLSPDRQLQSAASDAWWSSQVAICGALNSAAMAIFKRSGERVWTHISVTEQEVIKGLILPENNKATAFFFHRVITDLDPSDDNARFYKDLAVAGQADDSAQKLLTRSQEKVRRAIPPANMYRYEVPWNPEGITVENSGDHVRRFAAEFSMCMMDRIDLAIYHSPPKDPLSKEIVAHARTAYRHSVACWGREKVIARLMKYIKSDEDTPLVVHGPTGIGKTAVLGKLAHEAKFDNENRMVLVRFCGQTADSAVTSRLLRSICMQLAICYGMNDDPAEHAEELQKSFPQWLELATRERPLLLIIDSLELIERSTDDSTSIWIPKKLPPYCKVIVSCLTDDPTGTYQMLEERLLPDHGDPNEDRELVEAATFHALRGLEVSKVDTIIDQWLTRDERQLQASQRAELRAAVTQQEDGTPALQLAMAYNETRRWASYDIVTPLPRSVYGLIDSLFDWLERYHSHVLLSHTFGYLSASRHGLSEKELLDLLSCDEEVLNAVLQYHQPPQRRLPPLVFTRLRNDLRDYLVELGADGTVVLGWAHRPFDEAATRRYLATVNLRRERAKMIADYFDGVQFLKHYSRGIDSQPLYFGDKNKGELRVPNLRKLSELPHALSTASEFSRLSERLSDLEIFQIMASDEVMKFDLMECWREIETNLEGQHGADIAQVYANVLKVEVSRPEGARRSPKELAMLHDLTVDVLSRATKYEAAVAMCRKSLELHQQDCAENENDPVIAATYSTLGTLLGSVGKYDDALEYSKKSQAILEKNEAAVQATAGGAGVESNQSMSPEVCKSLCNLAGMHLWLGEYRESLIRYRQVQRVMQRMYGQEHAIVATLNSNIGSLYQQMGRTDDAIQYLEIALATLKSNLGANHPNVSNCMSNLATAYLDKGMKEYLEKAKDLIDMDVNNTERVMGAFHPELAVSLNNRAMCYMRIGCAPGQTTAARDEYLLSAKKYAMRAKEIYEQVFGTEETDDEAAKPAVHTLLAGVLNTLGCVFVEQGKPQEARPYFQASADMVEEVLGSQHPKFGFVLLNLAHLLKALAMEQKALPLFEKIVGIKKVALAAMEGAMSATDHGAMGRRLSRVESIAGEGLPASPPGAGETLPTPRNAGENRLKQMVAEVAQGVEELAEVHQSLGMFKDALAYREEAVELYSRALGEDHILVVGGLNELAVLYEKLGGEENHKKALACVERRLKNGGAMGVRGKVVLLPPKR